MRTFLMAGVAIAALGITSGSGLALEEKNCVKSVVQASQTPSDPIIVAKIEQGDVLVAVKSGANEAKMTNLKGPDGIFAQPSAVFASYLMPRIKNGENYAPTPVDLTGLQIGKIDPALEKHWAPVIGAEIGGVYFKIDHAAWPATAQTTDPASPPSRRVS